MSASLLKLECAPWVATRTYLAFTDESRSIISNEKRHEFLILEGGASDIWKMICDGATYEKLRDYCQSIGLCEELDGFLDELSNAELFEKETATGHQTANRPPSPKPMETAQNTSPELEMMEWTKEKGFLWSAFIEVTNRCNERCVHCFNHGAPHRDGERRIAEDMELDTEEWCNVIDTLADIGVFRLTISGGEATLRRDILDVVRHARRKGMAVDLYTNGLSADEEFMEALAAVWPHRVGVSVYSASPEVHDAITHVQGSHKKSVDFLRALNNRGIKTSLKAIQLDCNVQGYELVRELGISLGAAVQLDMALTPGVDGDLAPLNLAIKSFEELVVMAATEGSPLYVGESDPKADRTKEQALGEPVCGAGHSIMNICANGDVTPCNTLPLVLGNIRSESIKAIWDSQESASACFGYRANMTWKNIVLQNFSECGEHDRCAWCRPCPAASALETGDPLGPSPINCRNASARQIAAEALREGLTRNDLCAHYGIPEIFGRSLELRPIRIDHDDRDKARLPMSTVSEWIKSRMGGV